MLMLLFAGFQLAEEAFRERQFHSAFVVHFLTSFLPLPIRKIPAIVG